MQTTIKRRFIAYALAVAVLIGASVYKPQRVDAVALTSTAAVVALVASVMTACGVTYWASTQEDAVSYLGGKIEEYIGTLSETYSSLLEWLGINTISDAFSVLNGGILRVPTTIANKILEFVSWYNEEENVESGGESITNASYYPVTVTLPTGATGVLTAQYISANVLYVHLSGYSQGNGQIVISSSVPLSRNDTTTMQVMSATDANFVNYLWDYQIFDDNNVSSREGLAPGNSVSLTTTVANGHLGLILNPLVKTGVSGDLYFQVTLTQGSLQQNAATVIVEPSDSVVVPPALEQGESLIITTTAPITQGDSNEEACQAILDTVISQDGLSSSSDTEVEATIPSAWQWLFDLVHGLGETLTNIYDLIRGIPSSIASAISAVLTAAFVPTEAYVATFVASLYSTFDNHFSILSYPFSLLGTFITKVGTIGSSEPIFTWGNIYEPFSGKLLIPAGSYNLNNALQNQAFAYAHSIYMIVIKGLLSFQFVSFLYAWFCDVFHMKNSDFDSPFEEDGEEE